jgi:predicted permease
MLTDYILSCSLPTYQTMRRSARAVKRIVALFRRRRLDADLDAEIATHLEEAAAELHRGGLTRSQALHEARRRFGGLSQVHEAHRDARSAVWLERPIRDVRHAARLMRRQPVITVTAIGVLALGVGANSALVQVAHTTLVKPLPYVAPDDIYSVELIVPERREQIPTMPIAGSVFLRWRDAQTAVTGITALRPWEVNLTNDGEPERLGGARVSANFFAFLGIPIALGRGFEPTEEQPGRERVVILSDTLWRRRYNADPSIVGRLVSISDEPHRVVGIAASSTLVPTSTVLHVLVPFAPRVDVWKPLTTTVRTLNQESWDHGVLVRLPGERLETGRSQLAAIANEMIRAQFPGMSTTADVRLVPIRDVYAGRVRVRLLLVLAASGLLLVAATASFLDLLMARMASRAHELTVRLALGASRSRLTSQVLAETLLVAAAGGVAASVIADVAVRAIAVSGPNEIRALALTTPGPRLWLFALVASLCLGLVCAILATVQAVRPRGLSGLRAVTRGARGLRHVGRQRQFLVGVQMTLATLLLCVSALLLHSLVRLNAAERGYDTDGVLAVDLSLFGSRYESAEARIAFYAQLAEQTRTLPGVVAAGAINDLPALAAGGVGGRTIFREDDTAPFQAVMLTRPVAVLRSVTPGYFTAAGTALRAGRFFHTTEPELVALVSESLAHQLWPGAPLAAAVGRRVRQTGDVNAPLIQVVGVVADVHVGAMDRAAPLAFYRPYPQWASGPMALLVRTTGDAEALISPVRSAIRALDSNLPIADIRTMRQVVASTVAERQFQTTLTMLFATVALLVGAVGLYGVVSYSVTCRRGEIGVRIALGAGRRDVMRWVFLTGMHPVVVGVVVGLAASAATSRVMTSLLYEVSATDPTALVGVTCLLAAVSSLACYVPARRAAATDPIETLRQDSAA